VCRFFMPVKVSSTSFIETGPRNWAVAPIHIPCRVSSGQRQDPLLKSCSVRSAFTANWRNLNYNRWL
jgi:hypothetical protein